MPRMLRILPVLAICSLGILARGNDAVLAEQLSWDGVLKADHRAAGNAARDQYRHPLETLSFIDLQPCDTVVEIWPGAGWYTEILAPLLKDCGKLYVAHFASDSKVTFFRRSRAEFEQKLQARPDVYSGIITTTLAPPQQLELAPPGTADKVLTFRNVHNWLKAGSAEAVFASAFAALKPGGIFAVVEHRADAGTSMQDMIASGYVSEATVVALAEQAGFLLLDKSEINANPADLHRHPAGVWTLPPTLRLGDKHRDKYLNIGESDRMTLKFGKPVHE